MSKMNTKKLTRSADNRVLGGALAGLAEYFGVDATLVRICYVALTIFSAAFPGLLLYIIMLLLMPEPPKKTNKSNFEDAEVVG